jgi:hypothetical protein
MAHEQERSQDENTEIQCHEKALAMDRVDGGARGGLHDDGDQPAQRECVTDAGRTPTAGSKAGRQKWTQPGLHVSEKEVEPLDGTQAPPAGFIRVSRKQSALESAMAGWFRKLGCIAMRTRRATEYGALRSSWKR